ncbi:hypothetical protein THOM_0739, partial [Trachipleistophora hominis]
VVFGVNRQRRNTRLNYNEAKKQYRRRIRNKHTYNQKVRRTLGLDKVKIADAKREKTKQLRYYTWSRKRPKQDRTIYEDENEPEKRKRKSVNASDNLVLMRIFNKKLIEMMNGAKLMIGKANKKLLMMLFSIQFLIDYYKVGNFRIIANYSRCWLGLKRSRKCYKIEKR